MLVWVIGECVGEASGRLLVMAGREVAMVRLGSGSSRWVRGEVVKIPCYVAARYGGLDFAVAWRVLDQEEDSEAV